MALSLTSNVSLNFQDSGPNQIYKCEDSESNHQWPMQPISNYIDLENPNLPDFSYGVIVDPNLCIKMKDNPEIKSVFTVMELEHFRSKFEDEKLTIDELVKSKIKKNQIVKLWKNANEITRIGVLNHIIKSNSDLAALGICEFNEESFTDTYDIVFFHYDRPVFFEVKQLHAMLTPLTQKEYNRFLKEFKAGMEMNQTVLCCAIL